MKLFGRKNKNIVVLAYASLLLVVISQLACTSVEVQPSSVFGDSRDTIDYTDDLFELSDKAEKAYSESRWSDAVRLYQGLIETVPNDAYIWFRLANAFVNMGDYDKAISAYRSSISIDSMQSKPWFNLSTTYLLNAKVAMDQSSNYLRAEDPAHAVISDRLVRIDNVFNN